jgi:hypothetical protein
MLPKTPHLPRKTTTSAVARLALAGLGAPLAATAFLLLLWAPSPAHAALKHHGALDLHNAHNRVYTGYAFQGRGDGHGDTSGLIRITGSSHDLMFRNCVIDTNQDGAGNGVKIIDTGAGMHDITFRNCTFRYQPRMGFECIGREAGSRTGYRRVNLVDCTFQPSAGEAISYDDNNGTAGGCRVSGNLVQGAGVGDRYQYGKVFEINGTHDMTVTGNKFGAGRDGILNLQMHDSRACGWVFNNNVVDARKIVKGIKVSSQAQPVCAEGVHGGRFARNRVINRDSWNIGYFSDCHGMDWRSTSWTGPNHVPYRTGCSEIRL